MGFFRRFMDNEVSIVKMLGVNVEKRLSLQYHKERE